MPQDNRDPKMHKERETKDDGRYIIFYTFGDEEAETETPFEEEDAE
jgi:hypothetical protein